MHSAQKLSRTLSASVICERDLISGVSPLYSDQTHRAALTILPTIRLDWPRHPSRPCASDPGTLLLRLLQGHFRTRCLSKFNISHSSSIVGLVCYIPQYRSSPSSPKASTICIISRAVYAVPMSSPAFWASVLFLQRAVIHCVVAHA